MEVNTSSGHRECLAVIKTLSDENNSHFFKRLPKRRIFWHTDSKNNYIFMTRGSKKPVIQRNVVKLKVLEKMLDLEIVPVWTSRNHERIVLADLGSKFSTRSNDWGVSREILHIFLKFEFEPSLDFFASSASTVCDQFYSKIPQNGSVGVNFLAQKLFRHINYFCCPPTKMITQLFNGLIENPCVSSCDCSIMKVCHVLALSFLRLTFSPSHKTILVFPCKICDF